MSSNSCRQPCQVCIPRPNPPCPCTDPKPPTPPPECDADIVNCYKTKCGTIRATLTKTANPTQATAVGQVITYTYTVTNIGTAIISYPLQINDDRLGPQAINGVYILPGQSQSFNRTYTVTEADFAAGVPIVNNANVYIKVKCHKFVVTNCASATVTLGGADLTGAATFTSDIIVESGTSNVTVSVAISNLPSSSVPANLISLFLPFPTGVTGATPIVTPGSTVTVNGTGVTITIPSLAPGATQLSQFSFIGSIPGAYTWSGNITSATFDPNPNNNQITLIIILN